MISKNDEEDSISSKLKFYSLLKEGEKIDTKPLSVSSNSFINNLWRTFIFSNSRFDNLNEIKETVNKSFDVLVKYLNEYEINRMKIEYLIKDLNKLTYEGLVSLIKTYESDRLFCSTVSTLIENVNAQIFKLLQTHSNLKEYITQEKLFINVSSKPIELKKEIKPEEENVDIKKKEEVKPEEKKVKPLFEDEKESE